MPSSTFWGLRHLNGNVLCAVDIEMTGPNPIDHEIIEICVIPLDLMLKPHPELLLFNMTMIPDRPENIDFKHCRLGRADVARVMTKGFDNMKVADLLLDWFQRMKLNDRKKLIPLAYNYASKLPIIKDWLGASTYDEIFADDYRDTLVAAHFLNDREESRMEPPPFSKQTLRWMCQRFHIPIHEVGGSCMSDCMNNAQLYNHLLRM